MVNIGIETSPEPFEPNSEHVNAYSSAESSARTYAARGYGDRAFACGILALAAQIARIADVYEYQVMTGGRA